MPPSNIRIGTTSTVIVMVLIILVVWEALGSLMTSAFIAIAGEVLVVCVIGFIVGMFVIKLLGMYTQDVTGYKIQRRAASPRRIKEKE